MAAITVRETDGIEITTASGLRVVADGRRPDGDINVLSHAHGDHLYTDPAPSEMVMSPLTARLAAVRRETTPAVAADPRIESFAAGHIPGSTAVRLTDPDSGLRVLYTGDCSLRDRLFLDGFEPVDADILITEATYGDPRFVFDPQPALEAAICDFIADTTDRPIICMGYTLGRAQELCHLAHRAGAPRVYTSPAIARLNRVIDDAVDAELTTAAYDREVDPGPGEVVVLPAQTNRLAFVDQLCARTGAVRVGFSGWAVEDGFRYRGGYDVTFVLSDHCDFRELEVLVQQVDPDRVYVTHGARSRFAAHVQRTLGIPAQALARDQFTLEDF
ncbi:MAG: MBL fold metallo-hydrolase RNA specificity domain-containing protein [Haloquadratum sp.]|jgi:putative mRNA 3-end processing factor|nr:MBL fold metallo-hydrolase RNA specificity domain-containing protein [Haloferacaceae archaeon]MDR9444537.1 MBL fold metallo-hydrolase RNA specificity domain-containing protein [Haloquadratum sp.]